jgi:glycerophosphoryl diester phosphodiesterase
MAPVFPTRLRRSRWLLFLLFLLTLFAALYGGNASRFASAPANPKARFIAHRGVHQAYDRAGLDNESCTATKIATPVHGFLENTIPSMRAAFDAGAEVVELDVHPTTDGHFVVFHDWTLECPTNGQGRTRDHSLAKLKALDVGYGYTADGGATFPLRGRGVGLAPSLAEVFAAFPGRKFLVNFKSREAREGEMLAAHPEWRGSIFGVYGGEEPTRRAIDLAPGLKGYSKKTVMDCVLKYIAIGWSGYVPSSCRNTFVPIPINVAPYLWGWPNRFLARMKTAGSETILLGPYASGEHGASGVDGPELLASVPPTFDGYVWTNRIEKVGSVLTNAGAGPSE